MSEPVPSRRCITFDLPVEEAKGWGKEIILINCPDYCSKILCFKEGGMGSMHFHDRKHETWYLLEGKIRLTWMDPVSAESFRKDVYAGETVDIPRLCTHQVYAETDTRILEVSTPYYDTDTFRIAKGDSQ